MKNNFYFWRHTNQVIPKFDAYLKKINQLCSGDDSGLDIEKLKGAKDLYCLRLDYQARLIFTYFKKKICLLELLENHQYERSRFLHHPQFIPHLFEVLASSEQIDDPVEACESQAIPLELHQNQFIQFSPQQEKIFQQSLPMLVAGPAGSGKTCMAISMIANYIQSNCLSDTKKHIVYITKSFPLAAQLKHQWESNMPEFSENIQVDFLPYEQLLPQGIKVIESELKHFEQWFKDFSRFLPYSAEMIWQEFRIISGSNCLDNYLELGKKQSQFLNIEDRRKCYSLYGSYLKFLQTKGLCSPALFKLELSDEFDLLVVDEAQDLSHCQLANLNQLAKQSNIVYFLGDHQLLFDVKSKLNFIKAIYYDKGIEVSQLLLSHSYRNPPQVLALANEIIQTKYSITGGLVDSLESSCITIAQHLRDKPGEARWFSPQSDLLKTDILPHAPNHYFAVIVLDDHLRQEAVDFFHCEPARVFTPESIKGLEFKMVVIWKPLMLVQAREVNKLMASSSSSSSEDDEKTVIHRPKSGHSNEAYLQYFNRLITAVTRCQQSLIWVEEEQSRPIQYLIERLKKGFMAPALKLEKIEESTQQDWQRLIVDCFYQGNHQHAKAIFDSHLKEKYHDFNHFCHENGLVQPVLPLPACVVFDESKSASAAASRSEYSFAHPLFSLTRKKEEWPYKSELQKMADSESTETELVKILKKFRSGVSLENILYVDKCIKVSGLKKKSNSFCLIDWLSSRPDIWLLVNCMANHTQILAKVSIQKLIAHLGPEHRIYNCLVQLQEVQELLYQALTLNHLSVEEVLDPNTNFPVVHLLLKLNRLDLLPMLATLGGVITALDSEGNALTHAAALNKDYDNLSYLHDCHYDFSALNKHQESVAYLAAGLGDMQLFDTLTACGVDWYEHPLKNAVLHGHADIVKKILSEHPKSLDFLYGLKLFHHAIDSADALSVMQVLLECKLNPLSQTNFIEQLITEKKYYPITEAVLNLFYESKLPIETWIGTHANNIAHLAAKHNRLEVIEWLLKHEPMLPLLNADNEHCSLPLTEAIRSKSLDVLQRLVELREAGGFKPDSYEKYLTLAIMAGDSQIITTFHKAKMPFNYPYQTGTMIHLAIRFDKAELIPCLEKGGIDINQADEHGQTPLLFALRHKRLKCFQEILSLDKTSIHQLDNLDNGMFHYLAQYHQAGLFEHVLSVKQNLRPLMEQANLEGLTPLLFAVKHNNLEMVCQLVKLGVKASRHDDKNKDIVYIALQNDHGNMLRYLDNFRYDLFRCIDGQSPIYHAIYGNKTACLKYLLSSQPQPANVSHSPLFLIAALGRVECLSVLVDIKYNFYQTDQNGNNLLHVLMQSNLHPQTIKSFVFNLFNLDINVYYLLFQNNHENKDPIFYLVEKKLTEVIYYLDDLFNVLWPVHEALRSKKMAQGDSPPHRQGIQHILKDPDLGLATDYIRFAVQFGHTDLIKFFIELYMTEGAQKNLTQSISSYPLKFGTIDHALRECVFLAIEHGQLDSLKMLKNLGVYLNVYDVSFEHTTVDYAIKHRQLSILEYLVIEYRFMNSQQGYSLAHCAARFNACEVLEWLNSKPAFKPLLSLCCAHPSNPDSEELSPAMVAAGCGHLEALKTLIDCGVDIGASDSRGYDALWFTLDQDYFHKDTLEFLLSKGFDINKVYCDGKMTLLMKSAAVGQTEALPELLTLKADLAWECVQTKDNILMYCVANNQIDYLKSLLDYPVNLEHKDISGCNALHKAVLSENRPILEWMLSQSRFNPLLSMTNDQGRTPAFVARHEHEPEMVKLFDEVQQKLSVIGFFNPSSAEDAQEASQPALSK